MRICTGHDNAVGVLAALNLYRCLQHSLSAWALGILIGFHPGLATALCGDNRIDGESCCACDCNSDGLVQVDEIVTAVNVALGTVPLVCPQLDCDSSGTTTVDEIISCVNNALNGCPAAQAATEDECDDGGRCVGGANAGTPCDSESDCMGEGACLGGIHDLRACTSDDECAGGGHCRKCRPYGGDGCAANCTAEANEACTLVPHVPPVIGPVVTGSYLQIASSFIPLPPLPLNGTEVFTIGKIAEGFAPLVLRTSGVNLDRIPVGSIACACVRGVEFRTCGGTLTDRSGVSSTNCTAGFPGAESCPTEKACASVHGPGNAGSGFVACGDPGVDIEVLQDCNGTPGGEPFDPEGFFTPNAGSLPADQGSGSLAITSAISIVVGGCTGTTSEYGADGQFCTEDDPVSRRGTPSSLYFTTRTGSATVVNPADFEGEQLGPIMTSGTPFTCNAGALVGVSEVNLAGAFTECDLPPVNDIAATTNFVCQ